MRKINPLSLIRMNERDLRKARSSIKVDLNYMTEIELRSYLRGASKVANQRLREIEKQGLMKSSQAYQNMRVHFFSGYDNKLISITGDRFKFITNFRTMNRNQLLSQASFVADFLGLKTSTVRGIREANPKGYQTFKRNFEREFKTKAPTEDEMNDFWKSKLVQKFQKIYGSQETVKMLNQVSKPETLMKIFKKHSEEINYMARLKSVGTRKAPGADSSYRDITNTAIWKNLESGF